MLYEYYDPHPHVCHMAQYKCCTHNTDCPLYHRCSQMESPSVHLQICKQDCPNCKYQGCSLSLKDRIEHPIYINHVVQSEMLDLNIENKRFIEKNRHKRQWNAKRYEILTLLGDEKKKRAAYRENNREILRQRGVEAYKKRTKGKEPSSRRMHAFVPECKYDCFNCPYDDCVVEGTEAEIYKKMYSKKYYEDNREALLAQKAQYRESHREELRAKAREYYRLHKAECDARNKAYRESHKEELSEYFKKYNKNRKASSASEEAG